MENMGLSRGVQWGVALLEEFGTGRRVFSLPNTPSKKTRQEAERRAEEATADFSYIRWLGNRHEFPSGHTYPKKDRGLALAVGGGGPLPVGRQDRICVRQQPLSEPLALDCRAVP
jgi:hypothetical protein